MAYHVAVLVLSRNHIVYGFTHPLVPAFIFDILTPEYEITMSSQNVRYQLQDATSQNNRGPKIFPHEKGQFRFGVHILMALQCYSLLLLARRGGGGRQAYYNLELFYET
jgi:hypothetical protein